MKSKSLMIGDWVIVDSKITKVEEVDYDSINTTYHYGEVKDYIDENHISPIPLTAEILEKNGFDSKTFLSDEWEKEVYFREFPGCVLEPNDDGKYTFGTICYWNKQAPDGSPEDWGAAYDSRIKGLYYVHELQRALRLCGLNELADGFRIE